jgi:hypothetical protein
MAKPKYLGPWEILINRFGEHVLANLLEIQVSDMETMAFARSIMPVNVARTLRELCLLHGVKPELYTHGWKHHHGVMIACCPEWRAWTLKTGWTKTSPFTGASEELILATPDLVIRARESGWPY